MEKVQVRGLRGGAGKEGREGGSRRKEGLTEGVEQGQGGLCCTSGGDMYTWLALEALGMGRSEGDQLGPGRWALAIIFSSPRKPLHEYLCLSTGPWTPTLKTPAPQGGWLAGS